MSFLFGDWKVACAVAGRSRFGHTFGGPPDRAGTSRAECHDLHIHLLHRFDLNDPAVPFSVPGARWLPIYYCFDFRVNDLGYRFLSDDALTTFIPTDDPNVTTEEEWPDDNFPMAFPRSDIVISPHPYDPTDLNNACNWAGVFGIDKLSPRRQTAAKRREAEWIESLGFHPPETDDDFREAMCRPFSQGRPNGACLNPDCENASRTGSLTTVALIPAEPVPGVHTFGRWCAVDRPEMPAVPHGSRRQPKRVTVRGPQAAREC